MHKPTYYAYLLKKYLKKLGVRVKEEVSDGYKHIDLSVESARLDIEVDGVQHLTDSQQMITDFKRTDYSKMDGYETIHVHNADLRRDAGGIASAIAEVSAIREEAFDRMANVPISSDPSN
jgi:very-short-patch-repair endonuclease